MKKLIFLDIDGVLNNPQYLRINQGYISPSKIKLLNELEGCEIVISSSWGYDNGRTEKSLREVGLRLPIIGYTEKFYSDWMCRGNEIEKWIHDNFLYGMGTKYGKYPDERYEYVIFDDDTDFLLGQKDNFIKTDPEEGLTQEDINRAKKILGL